VSTRVEQSDGSCYHPPMFAIVRAYLRATKSFALPGMLRHFLWPVLASVGLWTVAGLLFWDKVAGLLLHLARHWSTLAGWTSEGSVGRHAATTGIQLALYLVSVPLALATAVLILESVALPIILDKVAKAEYPHVERRKGGSQWHSLRSTLVSFLLALGIAVVTLPLWLIPGVGVAISLLLSSWLNYRSFRYDVLMNHADAQELETLPRDHRVRLFILALGAGTLTLVPVVNLLAVPFAALAFAHYLLRALQTQRESATSPGR
jgi:CysZ protein